MTTQIADSKRDAILAKWLGWIDQLLDEINKWAETRHWSTHFDKKKIEEDELGTYTVPTLRLRLPGGIVHIEPVAFNIVGAKGRVDMESWPSLHRVMLIHSRNTWKPISEYGVPLKKPWSEAMFAHLAKELIDQV